MTKIPYKQKFENKWTSKNPTKIFDYISIADWLRTVSWSKRKRKSLTKAPTPTEKSKKHHDNMKNATKNFDYTAIADRRRTVSWSNSSNPTGVVKPVYGYPTGHLLSLYGDMIAHVIIKYKSNLIFVLDFYTLQGYLVSLIIWYYKEK